MEGCVTEQAKKNPLPCGSGLNPILGELEETGEL